MASTTERGYGTRHQAIRADLLATLVPGTTCPRCRKPMHRWQQLDAGHPDDRPARLGFLPSRLEHRGCNRGAGARTRNALARARRRPALDPLPEW